MKVMVPELAKALRECDPAAESRLGRSRLRFSPQLEAAFDRDTVARRRYRFGRTALFGLFAYNAFLVADLLILTDVKLLALVLHLLVVSPWLAACALLMRRNLSPRATEWLAASMPLAVVAQIEAVFQASSHHMADQYQYFVMLAAMFGNSILRLRFWVAVVISSVIMATHIGVTYHATNIEPGAAAMSVICLAGSIYITLISNAVQEAEYRRDWLRRRTSELQALDLSRDNHTLTELSRSDPLTGISNRRGFDLSVQRFIDTNEAGLPFSVIMLDVDHFKSFNDTYGHAAGDACLRTVAEVVRETLCCDQNVLARFGGEEFVVFMPRARLEKGVALAERIRRALVLAEIPHQREGGGRVVTASLGVAEGRLSDLTALYEAIARADDSLYEAKKAGRNRVLPPFAARCNTQAEPTIARSRAAG